MDSADIISSRKHPKYSTTEYCFKPSYSFWWKPNIFQLLQKNLTIKGVNRFLKINEYHACWFSCFKSFKIWLDKCARQGFPEFLLLKPLKIVISVFFAFTKTYLLLSEQCGAILVSVSSYFDVKRLEIMISTLHLSQNSKLHDPLNISACFPV